MARDGSAIFLGLGLAALALALLRDKTPGTTTAAGPPGATPYNPTPTSQYRQPIGPQNRPSVGYYDAAHGTFRTGGR